MTRRPVLGLTMGDPAGIGPELCLRALREPSVLELCVPVLFGDAMVLERLAKVCFPAANCPVLSLDQWKSHGQPAGPLVVHCSSSQAFSFVPGEVAAPCGVAAFAFIAQAIDAAMAGRIDAVVTAPVHKEALRLAGVPFPGHTEIFTKLTRSRRSCMMLRSEPLTVTMVTTHVGYAEVTRWLSVERISDVIELTAEAMELVLGRPPRLGICGLNPHAGEHGLFGEREEERFVQPAVQRALENGISIEGPLPPDTAFAPAQRKRYDALVTLYHDQGHIPFKMLAFETGVNITLGLPIIRTSVDHGTAFDIAWKGVADPQSLFAAIRVASQMATAKRTAVHA